MAKKVATTVELVERMLPDLVFETLPGHEGQAHQEAVHDVKVRGRWVKVWRVTDLTEIDPGRRVGYVLQFASGKKVRLG